MNNLITISQIIETRPAASLMALWKVGRYLRLEDDSNRVRSLERQIAQTDEEINRRVYVLYGLTEEEIAVVEQT